MAFSLGTARAVAGQIKYGVYDLVAHPTGGVDQIPVVIAQGEARGPVFWLTAGIHGPEHAGLHVIHELVNRKLVKSLRGTLVAIPALNPAGLRTMKREAYYHHGDPNRLFPEAKPLPESDPDVDPPSPLELAYTRLFEEIKGTADFMIDLHNAWTNSLSLIFRDRVYYRNDGTAEQNRAAKGAAEKLDARMTEMCAAYGHTIANEMPSAGYFHDKLQRSTTAAAVNVAGIPALTMELGTGHSPDPAIIAASVVGLRNVLRWAGMLGGSPEPITGIKLVDLGFPCHRRSTPRVTAPCIVRHLLEAGDRVNKGDPVAELRDIWGRPTAEKVLYSDYDGFILGRTHGIVYYPGTEIYGMCVRDELSTVQPYPKAFFN